ncbi:MAG: hypothetical protein ACLGHP_11250, partial [Vicinamibacteria bacterium]
MVGSSGGLVVVRVFEGFENRAHQGLASALAVFLQRVQRAPHRLETRELLVDVTHLLGREGARLVALPEYFGIMGLKDSDKVAVREEYGSGPIQEFLAGAARSH